jgi:BolA protein
LSDGRRERIEQTLRAELSPVHLHVEDESHLHAGHAGAREGGGHFRVAIVAACFDGASRVKRHRMIYAALAHELEREVHALAIEALSPQEWKRD